MPKLLSAAAIAVLALAGTAHAQQSTYTWTGAGQGSGKCTSYKMTIDVTVDGNAVKGHFQQQGRDERHFEATLDGKGLFKTKAEVGGGGSMAVSGAISDKESRVLLDGYCKFDGKLTKK